MFEKTRPPEFYYELEHEFRNLQIAKSSFRHLKTPQKFQLTRRSLITESIGISSDKLKHNLSPDLIISEYVKILKTLWLEKLYTNLDLTPDWVKNPQIFNKANLHPDFARKDIVELAQILSRKPRNYKSVVVHGDLCPVNIIFTNRKATGLIDLGDLHYGDGMLDIAVLSWTIRGSFGKKYEKLFFQKLNVPINDKIIEYYRLVYDLSLPNYKNWHWVKE